MSSIQCPVVQMSNILAYICMASRLYAEICCKITFCKQRGREKGRHTRDHKKPEVGAATFWQMCNICQKIDLNIRFPSIVTFKGTIKYRLKQHESSNIGWAHQSIWIFQFFKILLSQIGILLQLEESYRYPFDTGKHLKKLSLETAGIFATRVNW